MRKPPGRWGSTGVNTGVQAAVLSLNPAAHTQERAARLLFGSRLCRRALGRIRPCRPRELSAEAALRQGTSVWHRQRRAGKGLGRFPAQEGASTVANVCLASKN